LTKENGQLKVDMGALSFRATVAEENIQLKNVAEENLQLKNAAGDRLEGDLTDVGKRANVAEEALKNAQNSLAAATAGFATAQKEAETLQKENTQLKEEYVKFVKETEERMKEKQQELDLETSSLESIRKEKQELKNKYAQMEKETGETMQEKQNTVNILTIDLANVRAENSRLKIDLNKFKGDSENKMKEKEIEFGNIRLEKEKLQEKLAEFVNASEQEMKVKEKALNLAMQEVDQMERMKEDLASAKRRADLAEETVIKLQGGQNVITVELTNARREVQVLEEEKGLVERELEVARGKAENTQKEIKDLTKQLEEISNARDELETELKRSKEVQEAKIKQLTDSSQEGDAEISRRMEQLIANNTNLTFQIGELTKRNMEVVSLEAKASANARSAQEELSKARTRLAEAKDRSGALVGKCEQLTDQLHTAVESGRKASDLLRSHQVENERLRRQLAENADVGDYNKMKREVLDLRVEMTRLRDEYEEAQEVIERYEQLNNNGLVDVERRLKEVNHSWDLAESRAKTAEEALKESQSALAVATQGLTVSQRETRALERSIGAVEMQLKLSKDEVQRLQRANERYKDQYERTKAELEDKSLLEESPQTIEMMVAAMDKLKQEIVDMQTKLAETDSANKELLEKSDQERFELERSLGQAESKIRELRDTIAKSESKRVDIEIANEELEGQLKTLLQENDRVGQRNEDLQVKVDNLEKKVTHLRRNQGDPELEQMYDKLTKDFSIQRNELALSREKNRNVQSDLGALRRDYNKLREEHEALQVSSIDVDIVTRLEDEVKSLTKQTNLLMEDQLALSSERGNQQGAVDDLRAKIRQLQKEKSSLQDELGRAERKLHSEEFAKESASTTNLFSEVRRLREQRDELELQLEQARLSKVQIDDPQELQRAKLRIAELERELQGVAQPASNMKLVQKESEIKVLQATVENLRQSLRDVPNAPGVEEWVMKYNDVIIEKRQLEEEIRDEIKSSERRMSTKEQGTTELVHMLEDKLTKAMDREVQMKEEIDKLRNSAASSPKANKLVERQKKYINQLEGKVESMESRIIDLEKGAVNVDTSEPLDDLDMAIQSQVAAKSTSPFREPRRQEPVRKEAPRRNPKTLDEWIIGDEIEVYSRGLKSWLRGQVLSINQHYVRVKYGDRCKDLKPDSDKLRLYQSD